MGVKASTEEKGLFPENFTRHCSQVVVIIFCRQFWYRLAGWWT